MAKLAATRSRIEAALARRRTLLASIRSQIVELRRGGSEDEVEEKLRSMRGQTLYLKVIEMNRRRNRLILSERAAAQERRAQVGTGSTFTLSIPLLTQRDAIINV